jgi:hypothetical protein
MSRHIVMSMAFFVELHQPFLTNNRRTLKYDKFIILLDSISFFL